MDEKWYLQRRRILEEYSKMLEFDKFQASHPGGYELWVNDWLQEEVILLLEAKEKLSEEKWKELIQKLREIDMATQKENELYFQARDRALERLVDAQNLADESMTAFSLGMSFACNGGSPSIPQDVLSKIKTETNFGFSFVCGVLTRLEAVKGKHYAGSWQKRGEPVVLANVQRKLDRLDQLLNTDSKAGENLSQTLGDSAVYAIKWLALRNEMDPEEFLAWVKEVQSL